MTSLSTFAEVFLKSSWLYNDVVEPLVSDTPGRLKMMGEVGDVATQCGYRGDDEREVVVIAQLYEQAGLVNVVLCGAWSEGVCGQLVYRPFQLAQQHGVFCNIQRLQMFKQEKKLWEQSNPPHPLILD